MFRISHLNEEGIKLKFTCFVTQLEARVQAFSDTASGISKDGLDSFVLCGTLLVD